MRRSTGGEGERDVVGGNNEREVTGMCLGKKSKARRKAREKRNDRIDRAKEGTSPCREQEGERGKLFGLGGTTTESQGGWVDDWAEGKEAPGGSSSAAMRGSDKFRGGRSDRRRKKVLVREAIGKW